jgi:division protein CdvB (Snf7/Vps24/ESCRT-III family)
MSKDKVSAHRLRINNSINTMEDALDIVRHRLEFLSDDMEYLDGIDVGRVKMLRQDAIDILESIDGVTFEYRNTNPLDDAMND